MWKDLIPFRTQFESEKRTNVISLIAVKHHRCDLHLTYRRTLLVWHSYRTKKVLFVPSHVGLLMFQCSELFIAPRRTLLFDIKIDIVNK
jgi:hypothetical protein